MTKAKAPGTTGPGRRIAFANKFSALPDVYRGFSKESGLQHVENSHQVQVHATRLMARPDFVYRTMRCLAAQFCYRVLASRALLERDAFGPGPLDTFQADALRRFQIMHARELEGFSLVGSKANADALNAYEVQVVSTMFSSLAFEAGLPDFDELQFWRGAFLGLTDTDSTGSLARGFGDVFLDHSAEYGQALAEAMSTATLAPAPVVSHQVH